MFGDRYFGQRYFGERYFGGGSDVVAPPVAARFIGGGTGRSYPLVGFVSADERPDTLDALLVVQEATLDLVELDNDFLLLAAA